MNTILNLALEYREQGISCLPVRLNGKEPAVSAWKSLQEGFQTVEETEKIFADHKGNIAFIAGTASGNLACLDIEDKGLFDEYRQEFTHQYGETWTVASRRGGHILFRTRKPIYSHTYSEKQYEVLGQGRYHLAPPSLFVDTDKKQHGYEFLSKPDSIVIVEKETFFPLHFVQPADSVLLQPVSRPINEEMDVVACLAEIDRIALNIGRFEIESNGKPAIDKSRFDMSVIQTLANKGADSKVIREALAVTEKNTHFKKLCRLKGIKIADQNFYFSYQKAVNAGNTAEYQENQRLAEKMMALLHSVAWRGRSALSDRDAMAAHVRKFSLCKKRGWNLSSREGAELGEMSDRTFSKSTGRLINSYGYLKKVNKANNFTSESARYDFNEEWLTLLQKFSYTQDHITMCIWEGMQLKEPETHGVFERKFGLGKAAKVIWTAVIQKSFTKSEIATVTGLHRSTVSRVVPEMEKYGIVEEVGGLVRAVPDYDFKMLSQGLETENIGANRKRQHEIDREKQRDFIDWKKLQPKVSNS